MKTKVRLFAVAAIAGMYAFTAPFAVKAEEKVVATVNGKNLTELDLKYAEMEIGSDLGNLPPGTRRRVLVEYLIENILFADAAKGQKLDTGPGFDRRKDYWDRRALRDQYFQVSIESTVSEADAKLVYDKQVKSMPPKEEVHARHILVKTEAEAKDIAEKLARGDDFAQLAKENSTDPGSKDRGGDLGYFSKGQMVPQFEKAAFALKKGDTSDPVKSRFGFHIIKLDDRRQIPPPKFDAIKKRLMMSMMHKKAQKIAADLRAKAKIDYVDPKLKKLVEEQSRGSGIGGPPPAGQ